MIPTAFERSAVDSIFGVMGFPVSHSLSPQIFSFISKKLNVPVCYQRVSVEPAFFEETIQVLKRTSLLAGWNVTSPFKKAILPYLDELSQEAALIGAVNVVGRNKKGKWKGFNTDVFGILKTWEDHGLNLANKRALVFGAGGAASGVLFSLGSVGVQEVIVANRTLEKAKRLCRVFSRKFPKTRFQAASFKSISFLKSDFSIIVNATCVGMKGVKKRLPTPKGNLKETVVFDLVYRPQMTLFLQSAIKRGSKVIFGLDMLIWQALATWEIWIGPIPNSRRLKSQLKSHLSSELGMIS